MRKRVSRRRWKARAKLGQHIPWSAVVEHRLQDWRKWERRHDYMDARLEIVWWVSSWTYRKVA